MNSRERILAAIRREPVDYVPLVVHFWEPIAAKPLHWTNDREMLQTYETLGIDKVLHVGARRSSSEVAARVWQTEDPNYPYPLLHKEYQTPAGPLSAIVRRTEDWPWGEDIPFCDDFSPPRYVKPWIEGLEDVERLHYVLRPPSGADKDRVVKRVRETQAWADELGAAVRGEGGNGLDFVCWMCGFTQAVLMAMDQPQVVMGLVELEKELALASLDLLCELNVDYIVRRGWYESTDYWNPALYAQFARPLLEAEVRRAHDFGKPLAYLMPTGIMPLLPQLAEIPFDVLMQIEPALGGQDQRLIVRELGNTRSFHGGISAPEHLHHSTPNGVRRAVREAFEVFGHKGFMLGCSAAIRSYFPWENVIAMIDEWKRCRSH